jgi:hypothetical protein
MNTAPFDRSVTIETSAAGRRDAIPGESLVCNFTGTVCIVLRCPI